MSVVKAVYMHLRVDCGTESWDIGLFDLRQFRWLSKAGSNGRVGPSNISGTRTEEKSKRVRKRNEEEKNQ